MTEGKAPRCAWVGCSQPPAASLEKHPFCVEHFLEAAHHRINTIEKSVNEQTGARDVSSTVQSVLSEMVSQIPSVVATTRRLKPEVRDKFMSLSETAARLYMQARRPPRFDRNISCRVTISVASSEAPQKCSTLNVSQRGASVETTHAFQSLQVVTLQREDTGMRASAKVVWVKKRTAKTFMVGLEIMDHDDFWGLGNLAPATVAPILPKTASEPKTIKKTK